MESETTLYRAKFPYEPQNADEIALRKGSQNLREKKINSRICLVGRLSNRTILPNSNRSFYGFPQGTTENLGKIIVILMLNLLLFFKFFC